MNRAGLSNQLRMLIVESQIFSRYREADNGSLTRLEMDAVKALELSYWPANARCILMRVELHDLFGIARARIGHLS